MKKIIFITAFLIVTTWACEKECPACFHHAEPFRLVILNEQNENLLEPTNINRLIVDKLTLSDGKTMDFLIKDDVINDYHTGFYFLESIDDDYFDNCTDKEGEFYVTYTNSPEIDTFNVLIKTVITQTSKHCKCGGQNYEYIKHNGITITEYDNEPNNTGSAIIRK